MNRRDTLFLAIEVSSDFESLLLQSRAAFDRLINFISKHYGNDSDRFSRLHKILQNSKKDEKTDSILSIINNANWFEGKLIEDGLQNNLRSFVMHK